MDDFPISDELAERATAELVGLHAWKKQAVKEWGPEAALEFARNQRDMWTRIIDELERDAAATGFIQ
ncbi:MAG: hypothetical protein AAFX39_12645 [Pseudomonadota bacterium]